MPAANHPAYLEELERCRYTLEYVESSLEKAIEKKNRVGKDLENVQRHLSGESSADYTSIIVNTIIHDSLILKIRNLYTARSKPYFARIDFRETDSDILEKLYIGKMSLARDEDQEIIIVDWRAPIANLYYEGRLGPSSYECPGGKIDGNLELKRQFSINNGSLEEIFDIDITTNDEFLQSYLGASAENRLKEIVSTIQEEQNAIVRADMWKPLIVQGVAGSGKTTIALHRIAYLIYTYEKRFDPDNFMIIAPNRLFLNYISEVLPELGVEKVKQTTFEDFAQELIGKKLKITDSNEKLNLFVNNNTTIEENNLNNLIKGSSIIKTSMLFKDIIDEYIDIVEKDFIPKEDLIFGKKIVMTYDQINNLFIREFSMWPFVKRLNELKKSLTTALAAIKQKYIMETNAQSDLKAAQIKESIKNTEERQQKLTELYEKRDTIIQKIEKQAKTFVKDYISKISKLSPYQYYMDLMNNSHVFHKIVDKYIDSEEICEYMRTRTLQLLIENKVEQEDLAPIIYLKYKIYGMDEKIPVKHIVIDEAQDFSAFQFYVLKQIVKDSSFTILGDLCQGIHSYRGIRKWDELVEQVFNGQCRYLQLEQSYRTTVEIMESANKVISNLQHLNAYKGRPVIRHGKDVRYIKCSDTKEIASIITDIIKELKQSNYKSIAVICKTSEECKHYYNTLKKIYPDIYVVTGNEKEYHSGLVIVPSFLSKGLEFDGVIISNANKENYPEDELDTKLLYVSMTRALHEMTVLYDKEISPLLSNFK